MKSAKFEQQPASINQIRKTASYTLNMTIKGSSGYQEGGSEIYNPLKLELSDILALEAIVLLCNLPYTVTSVNIIVYWYKVHLRNRTPCAPPPVSGLKKCCYFKTLRVEWGFNETGKRSPSLRQKLPGKWRYKYNLKAAALILNSSVEETQYGVSVFVTKLNNQIPALNIWLPWLQNEYRTLLGHLVYQKSIYLNLFIIFIIQPKCYEDGRNRDCKRHELIYINIIHTYNIMMN